jgi:hypothetical protein
MSRLRRKDLTPALRPPLPDQIKYAPPLGYVLVYQGGHHNVYCNGTEHIRTTGGYAGLSDQLHMDDFACDCARYVQ